MKAPRVKLHPAGRAVVEVAPGRWVAVWSPDLDPLHVQLYDVDEIDTWPDYDPPCISTSVSTEVST